MSIDQEAAEGKTEGSGDAVVRDFIDRVSRLPDGDWREIADRLIAQRSLTKTWRRKRALKTVERLGHAREKDSALQALRGALPIINDERVITRDAVEALLAATLALIVRNQLPSAEFELLYEPFQQVIPQDRY